MLIMTMSETVFMSTIPADVTQWVEPSFHNQEITDLSSFCCFEGLYVMDDYMQLYVCRVYINVCTVYINVCRV